MDLKPGQMLGTYRIEERLVSGGMAKVYRALQASTGREVAIKVLPTAHADAATLVRFEREMRVVAGLQHPHILGLIDAGQQDKLHYIVLPLVRRGDLGDLIAREDGPLALPLARRIVLQLCDALDYAHAQGVVHRDVKPANVLLDERGNSLLADFGIALAEGAERLTHAGLAIGTPEYLAPEQANGQADARSDLYALGVIAFQMFTGRMPFDARGAADWLRAHRDAPVPAPRTLNPALPEAIDGLIAKAMAKSPDDRFQSAAEFAAAVRVALPEAQYSERVVRTTDAPAAASTGPTPRRNGPMIAAAVIAIALAGAVLIWRSWAAPANQPAPAAASSATSANTVSTAAPVVAPAPAAPASATPPLSGVTQTDQEPATIHDAFDDPRFENAFDPERWHLTRGDAHMHFEQHAGSMHIRSQEQVHGLIAEFDSVRITHLAARVRMSAPVAAAMASLGVTLSRHDRPNQWVSCYIYASRGSRTGSPVCTDQRRTEFPHGTAAVLGAWHDVELNVDESAQLVHVSADGKDIGELRFAGSGANVWYVLLSGWSSDGKPVEGDVGELQIEQAP